MKQALPLASATLTALLLGLGLASRAVETAPAAPPVAAREETAAAALAAAATSADAPASAPARPPARGRTGAPAVADWSERFRTLFHQREYDELLAHLDAIEATSPELYVRWRLGYLHARAALLAGDAEQARRRLEPFVRSDSTFESLALYHAATAAALDGDAAAAARLREQLLLGHPASHYWSDALADHLRWLADEGDLPATLRFLDAVTPLAAEERVQRDLLSRRVVALRAAGDDAEALEEGLRLLFRSSADDAAERVATVLDDPDLLPRLSPAELRRLADSMHLHRRWGRAVELLQLARQRLPDEQAEIDFAIGRAHFFAEDYASALDAYLRAGQTARKPSEQARSYWHGARAAQLLGDDAEAEALKTRAIAVPGRHEATTAALTGRLRLRVGRGDLAAAHQDLTLLRRLYPHDAALVDGAIAFAMGELAAGRADDALQTLGSVQKQAGAPHQRAEVGYWRGRAFEAVDPGKALVAYLGVLRAEVPTHFAYLARHRLRETPLAAAAARRAKELRGDAAAHLEDGDVEAARRLLTDAVLLAPAGAADLHQLAAIYRALPHHRRVLELQPLPLPAFPLGGEATRGQLLAAMGLLDEAAPAIAALYPLAPMRSGLTRALAYRLGGASRPSIQAAESLAEQVPDGYLPQLLPELFRELLYPRYFWEWIVADAERYEADPRLLVSIMREESRFNPRAKSPAAARGLMQLLLGTARQVAVSLELLEVAPEDLYDPRLVIRLGAKYVGDLLAHLDGDRYATAAAYNAGPNQARLWQRLAPAPGPDYFLSTVSFSETKHYVRKVLNSYERYGEIYQGEQPVGGTRAEP